MATPSHKRDETRCSSYRIIDVSPQLRRLLVGMTTRRAMSSVDERGRWPIAEYGYRGKVGAVTLLVALSMLLQLTRSRPGGKLFLILYRCD